MKIGTMRAIDRFAGVPLCWLTGVWNTVARRHSPSPRSETFLLIKFFGMGSVLLSTPVISSLLSRYPKARIFYLTFSSNREVLTKTGLPVEIVTISDSSSVAFAGTAVKALYRLARASIDVVFDLEFFSKFSTLVSVLSGARVRTGFYLPAWWRRSNLTHPVVLERSSHVSGLFLRHLSAVGIQGADRIRIARLRASADERAAMELKLGLTRSNSEVICINANAGATSPERRWRPRRFVAVAEHLVREDPSRRIFFTGSASERAYVDEVIGLAGGDSRAFRNCSGELSVAELVALFERSSFLVTNDSGPMHLAAAVGLPVIALFGPESPAFYGPLGSSKICYEAVACSPCLNVYNAKQFACPYGTRCMAAISTDDVLLAIQSVSAEAGVLSR